MMYIGVDFDGTIVDHNRHGMLGTPVPGAIKWMKKWLELDARLILFTMRADNSEYFNRPVLTEAVDYLNNNGISLFGVNTNPTQSEWTSSPKVWAHVYIDDIAFGCPLIHPEGFVTACVDWSIVGPSVVEMLKRNI